MDWKKNRIIIICLIIGISIGFIIGIEMGIQMTVQKAAAIIPYFVNITINERAVNDALYMYNNNIGSCFGGKLNAPIYNNKGD